MKPYQILYSLLVMLWDVAVVQAVTIETVPVTNPGNPPDIRYDSVGFGAVGYNFRIGKFEITNAQYVEFLNAIGASDPNLLYDERMTESPFWPGGIIRSGSPGSYTYAIKPPAIGQGAGGSDYSYDDKPVTYVSWYDAIRFANWLHNGQPAGPQDANSTEDGAYTIAFPVSSIMRNPGARWWLPSEDEWYKAAYHDPAGGVYYDYPIGTSSTPNNNLPEADTGNSANFHTGSDCTTGNCDYPFTDVGAYILSSSPVGTFDQGGNVREWTDSVRRLNPGRRSKRGGWWGSRSYFLHANGLAGGITDEVPARADASSGYRLATLIPEPNALQLAIFGALPLLFRRTTQATLRHQGQRFPPIA
jgi:formylglycine-generating enzyme required for sulfatase activity